MITLLPTKLDDNAAERVRRNHESAIAELQRLPLAAARLIRDVVLADGVATPVAHGLGRAAFAIVSPPRGAVSSGRIEEVRDGANDSRQYLTLKAAGWGASITVDVLVL